MEAHGEAIDYFTIILRESMLALIPTLRYALLISPLVPKKGLE